MHKKGKSEEEALRTEERCEEKCIGSIYVVGGDTEYLSTMRRLCE